MKGFSDADQNHMLRAFQLARTAGKGGEFLSAQSW